MRKWSDSDSQKKARSFAGPLDAIVRERFLFLLMKLALAPKRALPSICPAVTAWLDLDMLPPLEAAGMLDVEQPPFRWNKPFCA